MSGGSKQGITWGFGEVVSIANAFNQKTRTEGNRKEGSQKSSQKTAAGDAEFAKQSKRGEIEVILGGNQSGGVTQGAGKVIVAYPADANVQRTPLQGEHVVLFQGTGPDMGPGAPNTATGEKETGMTFDLEWYYLNPMGLQGSVHLNAAPGANVGDVQSDTVTADGEKKKKTDEYADSTNNPTTTGESFVPDSEDNPKAVEGDLSILADDSIRWFQEKEQQILDLYKRMEMGEQGKRAGGVRTPLNYEEDIKPIEEKIEEKKEKLVKNGFTGEFKESSKMFGGHDTNTGYLEITDLQHGEIAWSQFYNTGEVSDGDFMKTGGGLQALKPAQLGYGDAWQRREDGLDPRGDADTGGVPGSGNNPNTSSPPKGNQGGLGAPNPGLGQDFAEFDQLCNLQPYEGDFLVQGRFGQSLRFGSALEPSDENTYVKQPSWEIGMSGKGGPINILRAGQSPSMNNSNNDYIVEDINGDKASIYVCSGQKLQIQLASTVFDAINEPMSGPALAGVDENGNVFPSTHCSSGTGKIYPPPEMDPIPEDVEDLELLDGEYEYFQTDRKLPNHGKVVGTDRIRLIQGQPVLERLCGVVLQILKAAERDGFSLKINSAFRGLWQLNHPTTGQRLAGGQVPIRKNCALNSSWKKYDMKDRKTPLWTACSTKFKPYVAIPGHSRHQSGTAIDFRYTGYKIQGTFENQTGKRKTSVGDRRGTYAWLIDNTYKFGMVRTVTKEEWHFEYNPEYASKGPFGKLRSSDSNRWHGLDNAFKSGKLGPWPLDGFPGNPETERTFGNAVLEIGTFGLLGDGDGIIG